MLSSFTKLLLKASLVLVLVMALSALALHIWFVNNARGILKQIVKEKSHGKFRVELSQLSFDFFSNTLQVRHADLSSTDSTTQPATYHVKFNRLTLHVGSFWPLLLEKNLILDSIILQDPRIEVKQWRKDSSGIFANQELSVPQEMGRMYHSMLDVLEAFGIRRIQINNARLTLSNKMIPGSEPVVISDIYLNLFKTPSQSVKAGSVADQSQSIDLTTTEQDIALPGGRHRLAFKNFHLQLFRKRIEMDSCTITASTTDSASSSYKIFFKKLMLTGVDFDAMYRKNLIKADSVYCENPVFDINLDRQKTAATTKERPDAEKIIRELTGDLDLAFVGVNDAGIRININGAKKRSLYNSNRDDFQMYGLKINSDSSMPVSVDRFEMLVRDYHLYNQDSSATYSFDSIHFVNNKIQLSNFSAVTGTKNNRLHNERDFKIRLFELSGLDWYELVFNETLKAREAYLYNPVIKFVKKTPVVRGSRRNLFSSLQTLDDFMTLEKITVVNGVLDMKLSPETSFKLDKVNFSLYSNKLLKSINKEGIKSAVEYFLFSSGVVKFKDLTTTFQNVLYSPEHLVHADHLRVSGSSRNIMADVSDLYLDNLDINEDQDKLVIDGLRWKKATLQLHDLSTNAGRGKKKEFTLKNISGANTSLSISAGDLKVNSFIRSFSLADFFAGKPLRSGGLQVTGDQIIAVVKGNELSTGSYQIADNAASYLTNVKAKLFTGVDSINFSSPRLSFVPDVNSILGNDIHLQQLTMQSPILHAVSHQTNSNAIKKAGSMPAIRIDQFQWQQPDIRISHFRNDSAIQITIPSTAKSGLEASGIRIDSTGVTIKDMSFNATDMQLVSRGGDKLAIEKGKVDLQLSALAFNSGSSRYWQGMVNNFHISNPQQFKLGNKKKAFGISEARFGNIHLASDYINDADQLIQKNLDAWLSNATGEYSDSVNTFKWYNAAFRQQQLSVDSFEYHPTPERDVLLSKLNYQKDYITLHTGAVVLTGFKPDRYKKDSSILADTMFINEPVMTVYRDKLPPFLGGRIKPLPVDMIRNISRPVDMNTVIMKNGNLSYTERNARSRAEGTINLTQMQVKLENLKNRGIRDEDSLGISMNALLMDSALISLKIKQSYTDTLNSFLMNLRMKPTSLLFLNPVLTPLSNIKIISGTIDSVELTAIGREELAFGKMNMYYKNLRIELVKDGNPEKSSFSRKVLTFLANAFVIKRNNDGRTGVVYFKRLRDRSFFNYIIKMTFSGMATSIGVKKNRKYLKQYKRSLKDRGMVE